METERAEEDSGPVQETVLFLAVFQVEAGVTSAGKWTGDLGFPCSSVLPAIQKLFQKPGLTSSSLPQNDRKLFESPISQNDDNINLIVK